MTGLVSMNNVLCRYGDLNQITKDDYVDAAKAAKDLSKHGLSPAISMDNAIGMVFCDFGAPQELEATGAANGCIHLEKHTA